MNLSVDDLENLIREQAEDIVVLRLAVETLSSALLKRDPDLWEPLFAELGRTLWTRGSPNQAVRARARELERKITQAFGITPE